MEDFLEAIFMFERNRVEKVKIAKAIIDYLRYNVSATKKELENELKARKLYAFKTYFKVIKKLKALNMIRVVVKKQTNEKVYILSPDAFYSYFKDIYLKLRQK